MSNERYSPEFKDEAVRQIVYRGYPVAEARQRLGVSIHSLHKWVKAVKPGKADAHAAELNGAKKEILKLRAQPRRAEEERDIFRKGRTVLRQPARVRYLFISAYSDQYPVRTQCRLLDVSHSGYYAWCCRLLTDRAIEDERLLPLIRASYASSSGVYGACRVHLDLREMGETCGKSRVARTMKTYGIKIIHGYKNPRVITGRPAIPAPNSLQRGFTGSQPDTVWVTDITYIRT